MDTDRNGLLGVVMDIIEMIRIEKEKLDLAQARIGVLGRIDGFRIDLESEGFKVEVIGGSYDVTIRVQIEDVPVMQIPNFLKPWTPSEEAKQDVADQIIAAAMPIITEADPRAHLQSAPETSAEDPAGGGQMPEPMPAAIPVAVKPGTAAGRFALPVWTAEEDDLIVQCAAEAVAAGQAKVAGYAKAAQQLPHRSIGAISQRAVKHLSERIFAKVNELAAVPKAPAPVYVPPDPPVRPVPAAPVATTPAPALAAPPVPSSQRERAFVAALDALEDEDWTDQDDHQIALLIARGDGVSAAADAVGTDSAAVRARWAKLRGAAEAVSGGWSLDAQKDLITLLKARAAKVAA